jgi:hypothetical protein
MTSIHCCHLFYHHRLTRSPYHYIPSLPPLPAPSFPTYLIAANHLHRTRQHRRTRDHAQRLRLCCGIGRRGRQRHLNLPVLFARGGRIGARLAFWQSSSRSAWERMFARVIEHGSSANKDSDSCRQSSVPMRSGIALRRHRSIKQLLTSVGRGVRARHGAWCVVVKRESGARWSRWVGVAT